MHEFPNLRRLEKGIRVDLPPDEGGYTGRQCPSQVCRGYFKVLFGTGLKGDDLPCHCPYCGHSAPHDHFITPEQTTYLRSIMEREAVRAMHKDLKALEFTIKPEGPFGIGLSMKLEPLRLQPIRRHVEKSLETHVECPACTLRYAVYGVFAFCPDCRHHNSLQIFHKNIEIAGKMLDRALNSRGELAVRDIENALEDCISAFDGFGRELCRAYSSTATNPQMLKAASFQNLERARQLVQDAFGIDFAAPIRPDDWATAIRGSQKRHVLAHNMGVIDEEYIRKACDPGAMAGRKLRICEEEVRQFLIILTRIAESLFTSLQVATHQSCRIGHAISPKGAHNGSR